MDGARRWQWSGLVAGTGLGLAVTLDFLFGGPVSAHDQAVYDRITAWDEAGLPVHWWSEALTKPASPIYAVAITAVVVVAWWVLGQRRMAAWGVCASLVVSGVITVLKQGLHRELPPMAAGAWYGYSFPSGHTIGAAANLGLLILLGAQVRIDRHGLRGAAARRTWAMAITAWAILVLVVGIGRILTQRHWASDVLASFGIGTALACATLLLAHVPSGTAAVPGATSAGPHLVERTA